MEDNKQNIEPQQKKVSKFWEACQRLKGNITITDPMLFL